MGAMPLGRSHMVQDKDKGKVGEKVVITPPLRRIWLNIRRSWISSFSAFQNSISLLNEKEASGLYDVVKHSLFKGSYVEILADQPGMKEIVKSDEDRMCMHDIYEVLSWRLGRREELPSDVRRTQGMKGRIGRNTLTL